MSQVKQIKEAVSIVDIIGQRLDLKSSGSNYRALCPFHNEKTPSFFVNEQFQRYRCFGCGASGDVFNFLEAYEGMTFVEALEYLANQAGIKLDRYHKSSQDEERERLLEILNLAADYYHYLLTKHRVGQRARDYLTHRKIHQDSIKLFKLAYAANNWDGLLNFLHHKKKYSKEDILKTGLIIRNKSGRFYDRFRGRIMFPLKNHRGQVVGFSGRVLEKNVKEAKYINTPETLLYHKSKMLYGFSEHFAQIKKQKQVIVCEGEFDVIASSQNHVDHIVAIKGSALTTEQIKLFERAAKKVLLCLDTDQAGITASKRAIGLMRDSSLELRIIDVNHGAKLYAAPAGLSKAEQKKLPRFKDAGELIESYPKLWREVVKHSESIYEFLIRISTASNDPAAIEGKRAILEDLAEVLMAIPHAVEQDFYIKKIAKILDVKPEFVRADLQQIASKNKAGVVLKKKVNKPTKLSLREKLEQYLLFLTFHLPSADLLNKLADLQKFNWQIAGVKQVFVQLAKVQENFQFNKFTASLSEDLKTQLMDWYLLPKYFNNLDNLNLKIEWQNTFVKLQKILLRRQAEELDKTINKLDALASKSSEQETKFNQALQELAKIHARLKNL